MAAGQVALFRGAVERGFAGGCEAVGVNTEGEQDTHEGRVTWERGGGGLGDECHYSDKMHLRKAARKVSDLTLRTDGGTCGQ